MRTVDSDFERLADLAHAVIAETTEPLHQDAPVGVRSRPAHHHTLRRIGGPSARRGRVQERGEIAPLVRFIQRMRVIRVVL